MKRKANGTGMHVEWRGFQGIDSLKSNFTRIYQLLKSTGQSDEAAFEAALLYNEGVTRKKAMEWILKESLPRR